MRFFLVFLVLFSFGCRDNREHIKKLNTVIKEKYEENKALESKNKSLSEELESYKEFFKSNKKGLLTKAELDLCVKIAAELYAKETNKDQLIEVKLYHRLITSIAKSCSSLNFDIDVIYQGENVLKGIKRNSSTQAYELVLAAKDTLKAVNPSNYDVLACLDVIMSAYSRYNPKATSNQIKQSLDLWVQKIKQLGKTLSISQALQIGSMLVYFEILGK